MPNPAEIDPLLRRAVGAAVWAHWTHRLSDALIVLIHVATNPAPLDAIFGGPSARSLAYAAGAIDGGDQGLLPVNQPLRGLIGHTRISFHENERGVPATWSSVTLRL